MSRLGSPVLTFLLLVCLCFSAWADGAGSLVSQTPIAGAPLGASAWRIRYRSQGLDGKLVDITGVVMIPAGPAPKGGRDVVAWVHSTVGIAESCSPSTSPTLFSDIAGLKEMLADGYVVTATDLQGLGTPGPQPYLIGTSSGHAVLDSIRAARALHEAEASKRVVLSGVSQGAHATLWAARLAPAYAPELDVKGVVAAAPPTDLIQNFDQISNPFVRSLMTGYTSETWSRIYGIDLATFANAPGRFFIHKLAKSCLRLEPVVSATNTGLLILSHSLPNHLGAPWTKPLRENSVTPFRSDVPMLIAQGDKDSVVIAKLSRSFAIQSCKLGNVVRYIDAPDGTHTNIGEKTLVPTLAWIADRFAGRPPASDCPSLEKAPLDR